MRAKMSWPRSSVPNGWLAVDVCRRDVKSMSLIATFQTSGPNTTMSTITLRTTRPMTASRCRRKRRHASAAGETLRRRRGAAAAPTLALAVGDAGIEPAIKKVGDEVEEDDEAGEHEGHRHHDRRVVAQDGVDQERADAGDTKDLLGDDRAAEDLRHGQGDQRHHRDQRVAHDVLEDDGALAQSLAARRRHV